MPLGAFPSLGEFQGFKFAYGNLRRSLRPFYFYAHIVEPSLALLGVEHRSKTQVIDPFRDGPLKVHFFPAESSLIVVFVQEIFGSHVNVESGSSVDIFSFYPSAYLVFVSRPDWKLARYAYPLWFRAFFGGCAYAFPAFAPAIFFKFIVIVFLGVIAPIWHGERF